MFGSSGTKSEKSEAIRGVLNSGFRRDGKTLVCDGDTHEPRAFITFCPKVLAGIGTLPDTITSRAIPIPLSRATREELSHLTPARYRVLRALAPLRDEVAQWARVAVPRLLACDPPALGTLKPRHGDIWEPLLMIADYAGAEWPERARAAATVLHAEKGDATDGRDPGIALLADLRDLFDADGSPLLKSSRLAELLRLMEDRPWPEWARGNPISTSAIARLLRPFGITPLQEWIDGEKVRAYFRVLCEEAFRRYLPPKSSPPVKAGHSGQPDRSSSVVDQNGVRRVDGTGAPYWSAVPTAPTAPTVPGGMPLLSFLPDPDGLQPLPF